MASLSTVLCYPCIAEFIIKAETCDIHQLIDIGHGCTGRCKKLDLHHKCIVPTSLELRFSTPAPTGKKVFQSEKFAYQVVIHIVLN